MHVKFTVSLLPLLLCGAFSAPALAQSGILHLRGKIVAPVCTHVVWKDEQSVGKVPFTVNAGECGGMSGTVIATTHVVSRKQRMETTTDARTAPSGTDAYVPDAVWTTTYE